MGNRRPPGLLLRGSGMLLSLFLGSAADAAHIPAVGEVAPPVDFAGQKGAGGKKLAASYTDTLPADLRIRNSFGSASYAVEVLNRDGRGAGLSNQVHVPLAVALASPADFSARVTAQGVVLSWAGVLLSLPIPNPVRKMASRIEKV